MTTGASNIRHGDRGPAVTEVREVLTALGFLEDPDEVLATGRHVMVDRFDATLDDAVRAFQQCRGLLVDGIVGPATYRTLKEASYRLGARTLFHQFSAPMYGDDVATLQSACKIWVSTPVWSTGTSACRPITRSCPTSASTG